MLVERDGDLSGGDHGHVGVAQHRLPVIRGIGFTGDVVRSVGEEPMWRAELCPVSVVTLFPGALARLVHAA
ncbi:hypothetical protein AB0K14_23405 [Actinosynnema sp. NPDC050801]|uniref:hypothetical protein n=1 Tax=unclassified Actinosynnema TaxID=2637065 RepID=UPI00340BAB0C